MDVSSDFATVSALVAHLAGGGEVALAGREGVGVADPGLRFEPVIDDTTLVVAVALNYAPHVAETRNRATPTPITFFKPARSLLGHGATIRRRPVTSRLDYEGEIGIVVGTATDRVADPATAAWGVTAANDVSARDLQRVPVDGGTFVHDWVSGKALEASSPLGPCLVPLTEARASGPDGHLEVVTRLNGEVVQRGTSGELLFGVDLLLRFLAARFTLRPGDIVLTGTPDGVGMARGRYLEDGDVVEVLVSGVPTLMNAVAVPLEEGVERA